MVYSTNPEDWGRHTPWKCKAGQSDLSKYPNRKAFPDHCEIQEGSPGKDNLFKKILTTEGETFGSKLTKAGVDLVPPSILVPLPLKENDPCSAINKLGVKGNPNGTNICRKTRIFFKDNLNSVTIVVKRFIGFLCASLNFFPSNRLRKGCCSCSVEVFQQMLRPLVSLGLCFLIPSRVSP